MKDSRARWQFWIDRGGTFTDCLGLDPETGEIHTAKLLSTDRAPLDGIRRLLGIHDSATIPPCEVRMGTTIATNALLERRGARCALLITRGFRDLLAIGDQTRPDIFALDIRRPELLYDRVIEIDARLSADGVVLARPDPDELQATLRALRQEGINSLAVVVLHAYRDGELELEIGKIASAVGMGHVSLSHEVAAEIGVVGRGYTTVVDAYLTPLIRDYVGTLLAELPGSSLRIMQSDGGLTHALRFRGRNAILSGPAGGVVAYAHVARDMGLARAIGFDMGGTSTDVSCFDGAYEREYETEVAGVKLRAPMMAIHTVAAGGGSICAYNGFRFTVGPQSAGATPGPLCYGRPEASALTVTDINLALGRVVDDRFPFSLDPDPVRASLRRMTTELDATRSGLGPDDIAAGLFDIANSNMAEAIRVVTIARGRDARDYAMVVFGGAGGQHACPIARLLGIRTLVFDQYAGVLSAYGMGLADVSWHGEADAGGALLGTNLPQVLAESWCTLCRRGRVEIEREGFESERVTIIRRISLRYAGTDTEITIVLAGASDAAIDVESVRRDFESRHRSLFGYDRPGAEVRAVAIRVEALGVSPAPAHPHACDEPPNEEAPAATPRRTHRMWTGHRFEQAPVYHRESLAGRMPVRGPALILDATGTIAVDPGFEVECRSDGRLVLTDALPPTAGAPSDDTAVDPIRLEIFNNLFMSVATQMGESLRRTAISTNIRERLDFSCAIFDAQGGLVANAPHIPVHLGAMAESIKGILAAHPRPRAGDVYATNDPAAGGSHLPDITVVTPVRDSAGILVFLTASRGHHADVGGITPGSMPPSSRTLAEEGAVLRGLTIVRDGRFDEDLVRGCLAAGPHPARDPDSNVADLQAQIAANQTGAQLLHQLLGRYGKPTALAYMGHVQDNAAAQVAAEIGRLEDGTFTREDALDDGTPICVTLRVRGEHMDIDFAGTGPQVEGNLNAPRAVTVAAVVYVMRALVGTAIPLNQGCTRPVTLRIPPGCVLDPDPHRAVAGGNVETSQRVVDVLLGALGVAAASQGTMNNLTFGTDRFGYYETIGGGSGATPNSTGASGVQTHMTNTRITDPEVLEARYPVRLRQFSLRRDSGGAGERRGGEGIVREFELLAPMRVSVLSERRTRRPFGLAGGEPGAAGRNLHNGKDVGGKASFEARAGDVVRIETPGGGGYGALDPASSRASRSRTTTTEVQTSSGMSESEPNERATSENE